MTYLLLLVCDYKFY